MSGYLHNLARRALRRTAVLHSVATLPFAAALSMPPQEEESHVDLRPPARSPDSEGAAKQAGKGRVNRAAQVEGARAHRAPERAPLRTRTLEPLVPVAIEAAVRASQPLARAGPPAATADTAPRSAAAAASESDRTTLADEPHESAHEDPSGWPETTVLHAASAARVTAVPARRVTPATAAQKSRPVRPETATEVHLSIGRVEVAVLAQAPAPKEARPRVSRTMSLAEYERRRRERDR